MDSHLKDDFIKDINGKSGLRDDIPQPKLDFIDDKNKINPNQTSNINNNNLYTHNPYLQKNEGNKPYVPMNGNLMGPNNFPFKPNNPSFGARYDPMSPFGAEYDFAPQYDEFGVPMNPMMGNRRNQGFSDINPFGNINPGNNRFGGFGGGFGGNFGGGFGGGFI